MFFINLFVPPLISAIGTSVFTYFCTKIPVKKPLVCKTYFNRFYASLPVCEPTNAAMIAIRCLDFSISKN